MIRGSKVESQTQSFAKKSGTKAFSPKRGLIFTVNGASAPPPPPQIPRTHPCPPSPSSKTPPPFLGFSVKPPSPPRRKGGGGEGPGVGGGPPRPHLPRKRAPFSAKTPFYPYRWNFKTIPWNRRPPQKVLSNPPEGSIEPLKRFYRTLKGSIEPLFGPQKGSIEPLWIWLSSPQFGFWGNISK